MGRCEGLWVAVCFWLCRAHVAHPPGPLELTEVRWITLGAMSRGHQGTQPPSARFVLYG